MLAAESFVRSGKVRDLYGLGPDRLLLVASDRVSAFDVVLPTDIPDKGRVLTGLSRFWFHETAAIVPNHVLGTDPADLRGDRWTEEERDELRGRMVIARQASVLPVELVVRGYISGSGWKEYRRNGSVCGVPLPAGLHESDRLPEPIFTPATKVEVGHDINIDFVSMVQLLEDWAPNGDDWLGREAAVAIATRAREAALRLYAAGVERCARAGIILADTKFEMGLVDGELILVDEAMTPDSSRFWEVDGYEPGRAQASYDKQPLRDWLETQPWDKMAPGPELPATVVADMRARYVHAFERITGASFRRYLEEDVIAP